MKIIPESVKGFQDFLPPDSLKRKKIKFIIEKYFQLYGFQPVETPTIEFDELMKPDNLANDTPDEAISDRFRLKDRANRDLGLRYEFTFQLARIFKENPNIKLPFRRYQIGQIFRDEPTRPGRYREFTQCDADIIGPSNLEADAECLSLISETLKALKIEAEIQINNRQLLNSIIESVQSKNNKYILKELDKIEKIGEDQVKVNLKKWLDLNQIITIFKLLEKPLDFFIKNAFDGAEALEDLLERCQDYGIKPRFNPFLVRGLGYYSGTIFEVLAGKDSIAAGGRYDKLVGKYIEREVNAVGISFGLERLTKLAQVNLDKTKSIIIPINEDKIAINLANTLRKNNISCILTFQKPGKALEFANSQGIQSAIFIGEDEVDKKKFKIRNMQTGEEKLLSQEQLIERLS